MRFEEIPIEIPRSPENQHWYNHYYEICSQLLPKELSDGKVFIDIIKYESGRYTCVVVCDFYYALGVATERFVGTSTESIECATMNAVGNMWSIIVPADQLHSRAKYKQYKQPTEAEARRYIIECYELGAHGTDRNVGLYMPSHHSRHTHFNAKYFAATIRAKSRVKRPSAYCSTRRCASWITWVDDE